MGKLFALGLHLLQRGSWGALVVIIALSAFEIFALINTTLPYMRGKQIGTLSLNAAQVAAMTTVANEYQPYTIAGSRMVDTGLRYHVTMRSGPFETGGYTTYYGLLTVGDRLLLVGSGMPIDSSTLAYRGTFDDFMYDEIRNGVAERYPEFQSRILSVYFHRAAETPDETMIILVIGFQIVVVGLIIYGLWRFLTVTVFPESKAKPEPTVTPQLKAKPGTQPEPTSTLTVPTTKTTTQSAPRVMADPKAKLKTATQPVPAAKPSSTSKATPTAQTTQSAPRVMADPKSKLRALTKPKSKPKE